MKDKIVIVSTSVANVLINNCQEEYREMTENFAPHIYVEDYENINKESGKNLVHALIFNDKSDAIMCTDMLNNFAKSFGTFRLAMYGPYMTEEKIKKIKLGEFLFENL